MVNLALFDLTASRLSFVACMRIGGSVSIQASKILASVFAGIFVEDRLDEGMLFLAADGLFS
jgi:hypothetical protein